MTRLFNDRPAQVLPLSRRARTTLRAVHVIVSVGWFGLVVAMMALGIGVATAGQEVLVQAGLTFMDLIGGSVIPAFAVATLLSGLVLSVGTKWGLVRHWWIVVKFALTMIVIVTAVNLTQDWIAQGLRGPAEASATGWLLVAGSTVHLLMLAAATVISVQKPWGRIRLRRFTRVWTTTS